MRPLTSFALFLTASLSMAAAQTASAQVETTAPAGGSMAAQRMTAGAKSDGAVLVEFTINQGGTYVLSAPTDRALKVRYGGVIVLDTTLADANTQATAKAVVSFISGNHSIAIEGRNIAANDAEMIMLKRLNTQAAVTLTSLSSTLPVFVAQAQNQMPLTRPALGGTASRDIQSQVLAVLNQPTTVTGTPTVEGTRAADDIRSVINDALTIIDPTPPPPLPMNDGAASSPLGPPLAVAPTQAVEIISGPVADDRVASTGQTLFGRVLDSTTYDIVNVTVSPSGRTTTVEVGPIRGGFAVRLFEEDLTTGAATVTVSAGSTLDSGLTTAPVTYNYTAAAVTDGIGLAMSRTTFGATADLYARARTIGYRAYIEEQLSPATIDDSLFEAMRVDRLRERNTNGAIPVATALQAHNLATATYTKRQLQEVMGAFWSNHLHAANKMSQVLTQAYDDRQYYRENAMGQFEDLLLYSARSPLMSQFLDNDQNRAGNLNENYGREILELHTVGVDAGYGDEDIIAVSRIFTGWTFRRTNPNSSGPEALFAFEFRPERHDTDDKYIPFLDITITGRSGPAGVEEGEELIALLAQHPSTQAFVCRKIVQWFVADAPPANFVQICVDAWAVSDGNTREILRAILLSPEFITTPDILRAKGKNPFEYGVSVLRAAGVEVPDVTDTNIWHWYGDAAKNAGYNPAEFPVPTGLPEFGRAWSNTSVFVAEFNAGNIMFANRRNNDILMQEELAALGLETAEEIAAYILTIGTADLYRQDEFDAIVTALKGEDGVFRLRHFTTDVALGRAITMLTVIPSFHLQ